MVLLRRFSEMFEIRRRVSFSFGHANRHCKSYGISSGLQLATVQQFSDEKFKSASRGETVKCLLSRGRFRGILVPGTRLQSLSVFSSSGDADSESGWA